MAALALAVAALTATGVAYWAWARSQPDAIRRDDTFSVLLITIDTLRADALGAYGNIRAATPWMDRLAREGVRFETAHAHNVVTLPSHANIFSGRYPFDHGVRDNASFRFPKTAETLATLLEARGYATGAFVSAFPLDSRFGLDRGFDVYDDRFGDAGDHTAFRMQERRGSATVDVARKWLGQQRAARTFTWLHLYDPHFPYDPPEPYASRFRDAPYHGEVAAADAALGPLLEPLLGAGHEGRTLVVLTADHGEALGEHGESTHGIFAYEGTLRVPLVVYAPALLRPRVANTAAAHVDILPTILDALGIDVPAGLPGQSLLPAAAGRDASSPGSYFESLSASLNRGWAPLHGASHERWKYIDLPIPELYDLAADPGETHNLAATQPERLEQMRGRAARYRAADRGVARSEESAEVRERLRALGYVTAASATTKSRYTEEDDPKRLIDLDTKVQEVITRYTRGDLRGALALSHEIVKRRADMALAYVHMSFLYRELGDLDAAAAAGRNAVALSPEDPEVVALIGGYLSEAGRFKEARQLLEPHAAKESPDLDVTIALGVALAGEGRSDQALATFERARQLDPSNAMAAVNIGTVLLMRGERERARDAFQQALRLDPATARAHNSLGVIAAESGNHAEAIAEWRQAVALDPRDHETLYNLGTLLRKLGRNEEARPFFERYVQAAPAATDSADVARVREWLRGSALGESTSPR